MSRPIAALTGALLLAGCAPYGTFSQDGPPDPEPLTCAQEYQVGQNMERAANVAASRGDAVGFAQARYDLTWWVANTQGQCWDAWLVEQARADLPARLAELEAAKVATT